MTRPVLASATGHQTPTIESCVEVWRFSQITSVAQHLGQVVHARTAQHRESTKYLESRGISQFPFRKM
jgi:hypothetical protein